VADLDRSKLEEVKKAAGVMTAKSNSTKAGQNSSAQRKKPARTANSGTMPAAYSKLLSENPRFKEAKKSGKGFVIVGVKA
jgi:hypothetical protein